MFEKLRLDFLSAVSGKPKPVVTSKADPYQEKYPSIRGDNVGDIERFPKVTFGTVPLHLQMGMHSGIGQQLLRQRRGPYI